MQKSYDKLDRLKNINTVRNGDTTNIANYNYDGIKLKEVNYGNDTKINREYDELFRQTKLTHRTSSEDIIKQYQFEYDKAGNITTNGKAKYLCDDINRLTQVEYKEYTHGNISLKDKQKFEYDKLGNREKSKNVQEMSMEIEHCNWNRRCEEKQRSFERIEQRDYTVNKLNQYTKIQNERKMDINNQKRGKSDKKELFDKMPSKIREKLKGKVKGDKESKKSERGKQGIKNIFKKDTTKIEYDKRGNIISDGKYKYIYDYQNKLIEVKKRQTSNPWSHGKTKYKTFIKYRYDILGRRVSKIKYQNGLGNHKKEKEIRFSYAGQKVVEEVRKTYKRFEKQPEKIIVEYIYGQGVDDVVSMIKTKEKEKNSWKIRRCERVLKYREWLSKYPRGKKAIKKCEKYLENSEKEYEVDRYYYHKDQLGSVVAVTDEEGEVVEKYRYDVFGKPYIKKDIRGFGRDKKSIYFDFRDSEIGNVRLFNGRYYEKDLGIYYYRNRFYSDDLGRFISRDPLGIQDNINLYSYVGNNPVNYVDPYGLEKNILEKGWGGVVWGAKSTRGGIKYGAGKTKEVTIYGLNKSGEGVRKGIDYLGTLMDAEEIINMGRGMQRYGIGGMGAGGTMCVYGVSTSRATYGGSAVGGCGGGIVVGGAGVITYGVGGVMEFAGDSMKGRGGSSGGGGGYKGGVNSKGNKGSSWQIGNRVKTPSTNPNDFIKLKKGQGYKDKKTGEIRKKSYTSHKGDRWKVWDKGAEGYRKASVKDDGTIVGK